MGIELVQSQCSWRNFFWKFLNMAKYYFYPNSFFFEWFISFYYPSLHHTFEKSRIKYLPFNRVFTILPWADISYKHHITTKSFLCDTNSTCITKVRSMHYCFWMKAWLWAHAIYYIIMTITMCLLALQTKIQISCYSIFCSGNNVDISWVPFSFLTCIQMGEILVCSDNLLGIYNRTKPITFLDDLF